MQKNTFAKHNYEVHNRTLQRWMHRLDNSNNWDLRDFSRKPKIIHRKITKEIEERVISFSKRK